MLKRLYSWYGKTTVRSIVALVIVLLVGGAFFKLQTTPPTDQDPTLPTVRVAPAGVAYAGVGLQLIGTVKAVSQAEVQTEVAGQITSVRVALGDTIRAGAIIATQENATQAASVLQAEGVYEAALANAAKSTVSVSQAETSLESAKRNALGEVRTAYTTADNMVRNVIDDLFATNANDETIGFRLDSDGQAVSLVATRNELLSMLAMWEADISRLNVEGDAQAALENAESRVSQVRSFIETIHTILTDATAAGAIGESELASLRSELQAARTTLNNTLTALQNAGSSITAAEEGVRQAELAAAGNTVSTADAQVKQALGSLRAAQANFEKTILRSPITGTVNSLSVDNGDFVSAFTMVAQVANNDALRITTFVGERDRTDITIGQRVLIEGDVEGTVTNIAPAVDPNTRKVEVIIAADTETLSSGDTVSITIPTTAATTTPNEKLFIPITAVKFTDTEGIVLTAEDGILIAQPITIGEIRGSFVEVTSGLSPDTIILIDARGRAAGQEVEAVRG